MHEFNICCGNSGLLYPSVQVLQVASDSDDENLNKWFSDSAWRLEFKVEEMSQAVDVKCMSEVAKDQEKIQRVDR